MASLGLRSIFMGQTEACYLTAIYPIIFVLTENISYTLGGR
jgi:hypothetical protein